MNPFFLFAIVTGSLTVIVTGIYFIFLMKQGNVDEKEFDKLKKLLPKNRKVNWFNIYFAKSYPIIVRIPLVRTLAKRIRTRLQNLHADDERTVRIGTAKFTILSAGLCLLFFLGAVIFSSSLFTTFGIIMAGFYVGGILSDFFIGKTEKQMLDGFLNMIRRIEHEYQKYRMVKEALQEAGDKLPGMVSVHTRKLAEILESIDPEEALRKYYHIAPNHFARQIAGICWIVSELGDTFNNGVSTFLEGLRKIQEEIRLDILRREDLAGHLKNMEAVCVVPLLLLGPMRMWSERYFPFMHDFYTGQLGVLALVFMFVLTLGCLYVVRSLRSFDNSVKSIFEDNGLLQKFFRSKYFSKLVIRITPQDSTVGYFRVKRRLTNANALYSIKEHFARKLLFGVMTFFVIMGIFTYSHLSARHSMLNPKPLPNEAGEITDVIIKRAEFESNVIRKFKDKDLQQEQNKFELQYEVDQQIYKVPIDEMKPYLEALEKKIKKYKSETLQWYELLIAFVLSIGFYWLPDVLLFFRKFMREMEMQNEIDRFYSIISILMNIERITVIEILEWMHRNSIIFESQLLKCITDFGSGEWEALERLKREVNFVPMEELVEQLQESVENIPIKRAFDGLEGVRMFALRRREQKYQLMVAKRIEWAQAIGTLPMKVSVAVYLAFPFLIVAWDQLNSLLKDLPK